MTLLVDIWWLWTYKKTVLKRSCRTLYISSAHVTNIKKCQTSGKFRHSIFRCLDRRKPSPRTWSIYRRDKCVCLFPHLREHLSLNSFRNSDHLLLRFKVVYVSIEIVGSIKFIGRISFELNALNLQVLRPTLYYTNTYITRILISRFFVSGFYWKLQFCWQTCKLIYHICYFDTVKLLIYINFINYLLKVYVT